MIKQTPKDFVPRFFDKTAKSYDKVAFWATFGQDYFWKKEILKKIESANSILDLACGTGILTRKLASKFPDAKVTGIDITKSYLEIAQKNSSNLPNVVYVHQDAEKLQLDEKFDVICSSYIPKYCEAKILLKNCIAHLNPAGMIILHDFTYPPNHAVQFFWNLYFVLLNFIGNFFPSWKDAFENLPSLIKTSKWVDSYKKELTKHSFDVSEKNLAWSSSTILLGK